MLKFIPKSQKYKKYHKGSLNNKIFSNKLYLKSTNFSLALKALNYGRIPNSQLIAFYNCINKNIKKNGKIKLNTISFLPITKKPLETRMGKGKGNVSTWVSKIQPGFILCELSSSSILLGIQALEVAKKKLSLNTRIITNFF